MKQLDYDKLMTTSWADQFNDNQLFQIRIGIIDGVDVSAYANPEFDDLQMWQIRDSLY